MFNRFRASAYGTCFVALVLTTYCSSQPNPNDTAPGNLTGSSGGSTGGTTDGTNGGTTGGTNGGTTGGTNGGTTGGTNGGTTGGTNGGNSGGSDLCPGYIVPFATVPSGCTLDCGTAGNATLNCPIGNQACLDANGLARPDGNGGCVVHVDGCGDAPCTVTPQDVGTPIYGCSQTLQCVFQEKPKVDPEIKTTPGKCPAATNPAIPACMGYSHGTDVMCELFLPTLNAQGQIPGVGQPGAGHQGKCFPVTGPNGAIEAMVINPENGTEFYAISQANEFGKLVPDAPSPNTTKFTFTPIVGTTFFEAPNGVNVGGISYNPLSGPPMDLVACDETAKDCWIAGRDATGQFNGSWTTTIPGGVNVEGLAISTTGIRFSVDGSQMYVDFPDARVDFTCNVGSGVETAFVTADETLPNGNLLVWTSNNGSPEHFQAIEVNVATKTCTTTDLFPINPDMEGSDCNSSCKLQTTP